MTDMKACLRVPPPKKKKKDGDSLRYRENGEVSWI